MFRGTTIVGVRIRDKVAMGGDGQVTFGETIVKHGAKKVRIIRDNSILAGFAGSTADAMTLFSKFEGKLEEYNGNMMRAAVEMAREWRSDKILRHLEALLAVMDRKNSLLISGRGDVVEPDDGILGIGSGGPYALAAARAMMKHSRLEPAAIVEESLRIAAGICIYSNENITVESL